MTAQAASSESHARRGYHLRALADRRAWAVEIRHALDRLEPDQRIVLVASYLDGHSHAEIAGGLDVPETIVAATMARAMRQLAALLLPDNRSTR